MYTYAEMKKPTGLTNSEIERWQSRRWWLSKTWAGGYFSDAYIVAIAVFRRLLSNRK